jgi:anti-sigma regulatory factor (Ser/Thr protein kinase)
MSLRSFDPALDATIEFSPRAPSIARRAVEELAADVDADILRDAQLLVSEIVTNSVRHSGSDEPIRLRAWARQSGLKVEITDGGFGFKAATREDAGDDEGGRGLLILEAVADRWGVSRDTRARVWFELSPRPLSRSARAG